MEEYYSALEQEKKFLKNAGGKKYKISNGKLLYNTKTSFTYVFDLEAELYIADDTPITIITHDKVGSKVSGSVLMCESFQIVLTCGTNMGTTIGAAELSVEPWKLLEALQERLKSRLPESRIAKVLVNEGPELSTNKSISLIPQGHEAVLEKAKQDPITVVWGPPGTGKTHTMSEIAIDFLHRGKRILIVSHSNVSVDGVANKIYEMLTAKGDTELLKHGQVLRYGHIRDEKLGHNELVNSFLFTVNQNGDLSRRLDDLEQKKIKLKHMAGQAITEQITKIHGEIKKIRSAIREEEQRYVSSAKIVATTISKVVIDGLFEDKRYDVVMFDEVSMAYVPQVACAATYAKEHFICVGDFMQLPPIAQSEAAKVLCEDIFSYLKINQAGEPYFHPWLVMLNEQRRMHPAISEFAIKYIYKNLLKNHESVYENRKNVVNSYPFYGKAINYVDLTGCHCAATKNDDNSRFNVLSALVSLALAIKAEEENEQVSIITPYAAQTRMVRALIQDYRSYAKTNVRCATVHQFQGSESDVVIFDAVESFPGEKTGYLMGKDKNTIKRLINVAVTRARGKLIVVGNARFWEKAVGDVANTFFRLQKYVIEEGNHVSYKIGAISDLIEGFNLGKDIQFFAGKKDYSDYMITDMENAKEELLISLPNGELDEDIRDRFCKAVIKAKMGSAKVKIKCNEFGKLPDNMKEFSWGTTNAIFPVVAIDNEITWYGAPHANWVFNMHPKGGAQVSYKAVEKITARISGKYTYDMLSSLANLSYVTDENGNKKDLMPKDAGKHAIIDAKTGMGVMGLAAWVRENCKCKQCKNPLRMTRGKSGKIILYCDNCKKTELLNVYDVNHYISINSTRCPKHGCSIEAKVGKYGLYIKCPYGGEYIKLEEI